MEDFFNWQMINKFYTAPSLPFINSFLGTPSHSNQLRIVMKILLLLFRKKFVLQLFHALMPNLDINTTFYVRTYHSSHIRKGM